MSFAPRSHALYLTDNGRCLCGLHLGSSAKHTGRDISGQEIYQIQPEDQPVPSTPEELRAFPGPFKCEQCKAVFGRSVKHGVIRPVLCRPKGKGGACDVFDYASA